jgi:Variant SH3 domain./SH3 domain.
MAGTVVKCIYGFEGEVQSDLSLNIGDIIKISKVVSDDWFEGTCNGKTGQFPKAFVEKTNEIFDLAIAVSAFNGEQDGDLSLAEGEVIIITEVIDENWAIGHTHGGKKGTFPRAFVKQISFEDNDMKNALQSAMPTLKETENNIANKEPFVEEGENRYSVLNPFSAQGDTELNLIAGNTVEVLKTYDDFWLEGECLQNGKSGLFPRTCIDYPDYETSETPESLSKAEPLEVNIEDRESDFHESQPEEEYLTAIFDYISSEAGDLSFKIGDCIKVLQVIDDNWIRGELNGEEGVFPSNHVEKSHNTTVPTSNHLSVPESKSELFEEEENIPVSPPEKEKKEYQSQENTQSDVPFKPTKKAPPSRPTTGPKRPSLSPNNPKKSPVESSPSDNDTTEKPKKKAPPERPKLPTAKKDFIPPFSYKFDTESQPTVIIPGSYVKQGEPNVIILRRTITAT